jgi:hypothetical protein
MKKIMFVLLMMFIATPVVLAQESSNKLYATFKAITDNLDPSIETGFFWDKADFTEAESFNGLSGAIYNYEQHEKNVASLRVGVALEENHKIYGTLQANLINITSLYAPDSVKEALSPGFMGTVWEFLGKYGRAGVGPGFDVEAEQFGMVATFGGTVQF